jgi:hypothetical protein
VRSDSSSCAASAPAWSSVRSVRERELLDHHAARGAHRPGPDHRGDPRRRAATRSDRGRGFAATPEAARLLGLADHRGEISEGKRTDLVLLSGTVVETTALDRRIIGVWHDGRPVVAPADESRRVRYGRQVPRASRGHPMRQVLQTVAVGRTGAMIFVPLSWTTGAAPPEETRNAPGPRFRGQGAPRAWRCRESNPGPPSLHEGFSVRSPLCLYSDPPVMRTSRCDDPSRCLLSPSTPRPSGRVSPLADAGPRVGNAPGPTAPYWIRRRERSRSEPEPGQCAY